MTATCVACRQNDVRTLLDLGPQPPSNRFEISDVQGTETHPLIVGQCRACGLMQLVAPMASSMSMPRFEWLTYNEPEGHLDDLVARLSKLPGLRCEARIVGLSYKDDTTLRRFNRLGYTNTYRYDSCVDFCVQDPCAGVESVQAALDAAMASRLVAEFGVADLLLVRHVLEHAHDPMAFLLTLRKLVRPGGYLLFEMPDCTKFVKACDYSFIWEEHVTYFSSATLAAFLNNANVVLQDTIVYSYPLEDSLIGIVRNETPTSAALSAPRHPQSSLLADGEIFSRRYAGVRARVRSLLESWRLEQKRIAIFGAGHLAVKFVNMYALDRLIECVIDDHPDKQELLMPGSRLPIRGSAALEEIDICLLALSPESERKVLAKHQSLLDRGTRFFSIFALNPNSVYNAEAA